MGFMSNAIYSAGDMAELRRTRNRPRICFTHSKNTDGGRKDRDVVQGQMDDAKRLDEFCGIRDSGHQNHISLARNKK